MISPGQIPVHFQFYVGMVKDTVGVHGRSRWSGTRSIWEFRLWRGSRDSQDGAEKSGRVTFSAELNPPVSPDVTDTGERLSSLILISIFSTDTVSTDWITDVVFVSGKGICVPLLPSELLFDRSVVSRSCHLNCGDWWKCSVPFLISVVVRLFIDTRKISQ